MQRLNGIPLGDTAEFKSGGPILSDREADIICKKIDQMHKLGVIHNDIHQDNIFLDDKEPYIIDFGFSQIIKPNDGRRANFMDVNNPAFRRNRIKTLKNYYAAVDDKGKHPPTGDSDKDDDIAHSDIPYENNKQFCKKAGWPCERSWQAENTFELCKSKNYTQEDLLPDAREAVRNSPDSGYINDVARSSVNRSKINKKKRSPAIKRKKKLSTILSQSSDSCDGEEGGMCAIMGGSNQ